MVLKFTKKGFYRFTGGYSADPNQPICLSQFLSEQYGIATIRQALYFSILTKSSYGYSLYTCTQLINACKEPFQRTQR